MRPQRGLQDPLGLRFSAARQQGRVTEEDEDAEFAEEIRAAYESEQRGGGAERSRGSEAVLGQVLHEGFCCAEGSYRGDDLGSPLETGGPIWPGQGGVVLRRREVGSAVEGDEGVDEGSAAQLQSSEEPGSASGSKALDLKAQDLQARIALMCATVQAEHDGFPGIDGSILGMHQHDSFSTMKRRRQ